MSHDEQRDEEQLPDQSDRSAQAVTTPQSEDPQAPSGGPSDDDTQRGQGHVEVEASGPSAGLSGQGLQQPPADASTVSEHAIVLDRPTLESTGDQVVDAVLEQFDRVTGQPLVTQIEAAERVQETLQSRLSDLGDG
jgi:hypothetical protein